MIEPTVVYPPTLQTPVFVGPVRSNWLVQQTPVPSGVWFIPFLSGWLEKTRVKTKPRIISENSFISEENTYYNYTKP